MDKAEFVNLYIKNLVDELVELSKAAIVSNTEKQWKDMVIEQLQTALQEKEAELMAVVDQANQLNNSVALKDNQLSEQDKTILNLKREVSDLAQSVSDKQLIIDTLSIQEPAPKKRRERKVCF